MNQNDQELIDASWQRKPNTLQLARKSARKLQKEGNFTGAHSQMLSTYYGLLGANPLRPLCSLYALWHALWLLRHMQELNHNQANILLSYLLRIRERVPMLDIGFDFLDNRIKNLKENEWWGALHKGTPHQLALAWLHSGEVWWHVHHDSINAQRDLEEALGLEAQIRDEGEYGKVQLIRVFKNAARLHNLLGERGPAEKLIAQARALTQETGATDQEKKIENELLSWE